MKRQIITVTLEVLVPEDDENDFPKGYDRMAHFGSFVGAMVQSFSHMVVKRNAVSVIELGNEGD
jgi:hypothetical protein